MLVHGCQSTARSQRVTTLYPEISTHWHVSKLGTEICQVLDLSLRRLPFLHRARTRHGCKVVPVGSCRTTANRASRALSAVADVTCDAMLRLDAGAHKLQTVELGCNLESCPSIFRCRMFGGNIADLISYTEPSWQRLRSSSELAQCWTLEGTNAKASPIHQTLKNLTICSLMDAKPALRFRVVTLRKSKQIREPVLALCGGTP
mmetsp:Transcript_96857/g.172377  ORF Transcript_96857/g.172377 Transcript_96857/m.172377 type:complete len:204 (+) Transcript_96857:462-1073(+)